VNALSSLTPAEAQTLLKNSVGSEIVLAAEYMTHPGGSKWRIKSVNILGGTCVVAVTPTDGPGKGFFAPYKLFAMADAALLRAPEPTPAPAPVVAPAVLVEPRNEFVIDDFETDTPVYELFAAVAPDTDTARELFMAYVMEHSEFDTEPLEAIMRKVNVRRHVHWTDTQVTQMLMLTNDSSVELRPSTDDYDAPLPETPVEPVPTPAVTIHPGVKPYVVSDVSGPDPAAPKRRGRPPKARDVVEQPAVRTVDDDVLTAVLDNVPLPPGHKVVEPDHVILDVPAPVEVSKTLAISELHPLAFKLAGEVLQHVGPGVNTPQVIEHMMILLRRALNL